MEILQELPYQLVGNNSFSLNLFNDAVAQTACFRILPQRPWFDSGTSLMGLVLENKIDIEANDSKKLQNVLIFNENIIINHQTDFFFV
jgi:hypothetical protein